MNSLSGTRNRVDGSVLIIVLWVAFGLVSIALYFANSMTMELRAADNRVAAMQADQAIDGAARYTAYLLANTEEPGRLPDLQTYQRERMPVGEALVWFVGREDTDVSRTEPLFALRDETGKLNANTATQAMLEALPRMTPQLAAAIIDWRDSDSETSENGAEDDIYLRFKPPYKCKNAPFESIDELRLVFGMDLEILYGEDTNQNGILDPNENDGDNSLPNDNRDGRLDPGLAEYLTVFSLQPNTRSDGSQKYNVATPQNRQQSRSFFQETFGTERGNAILDAAGNGQMRSLLEFYMRCRALAEMTVEEFARIEGDITITNGPVTGLVNVNTASEAVMACIPGIGLEKAQAIVSYRQSNPDKLNTLAWVAEVLETSEALQAGPFITGRTHQFTADIAAVGRHGRGYRRVRYVFDANEETPRIVHRQDLTHLGWALGRQVRQEILLTQNTR